MDPFCLISSHFQSRVRKNTWQGKSTKNAQKTQGEPKRHRKRDRKCILWHGTTFLDFEMFFLSQITLGNIASHCRQLRPESNICHHGEETILSAVHFRYALALLEIFEAKRMEVTNALAYWGIVCFNTLKVTLPPNNYYLRFYIIGLRGLPD
jgi:hypothetical protein